MSEHLSPITTLFSVNGLVAVVTGGGTGIGLMIATALENNGATVYIVSKRLSVLEEAARKNNSRVNLESKLPTPKDGDIKAYQQALWNAGSPGDFSKTFEVNTTAIWYTTVAFLELLDAGNKRGNLKGMTSQVISVTSGGGYRKDEKVYSMSYTLSKAAATHLGKMLAHFLKDWNIRSNVIAPGVFPSTMTEGLITDAGMKAAVPLGRAGNMDDMGGLVLFLASKAGAYVNGTVHLIDGGRLTLFPSTY